MYTQEGVSSVANFITAYEDSQKNRDSHFLMYSVFFVSKGNFLTFICIVYDTNTIVQEIKQLHFNLLLTSTT